MAGSVFDLFARLLLDTKPFEEGLDGAKKTAERGGSGIGSAIGTGIKVAGAAIVAGATAVTAFGKSALDASISYETAFTGVTKTVEETTTTSYEMLSDAIKQMATETASSKEVIAGVMEAAGQLGVSADDIVGFTKTMIELGDTTNLSADEAAIALAHFTNITRTSNGDVDKLGAAIVDLGNNFATDEASIVSMSTRLAAAGTIAGLSAPDILALSTAMSSVGINAEAGGTAMSTVLTKIGNAVDIGGEKMETFAQVAGMSAEQFSQTWETSPVEALSAFIVGLNNTMESGGNVSAVLEDLGIKGIRETNMVKSLALAHDVLDNAVNTSNSAFQENSALLEEAEKRYGTTESQLSQLKEGFSNLKVEIGDSLKPTLAEFIEYAKTSVISLGDAFRQDGLEGALRALDPAIDAGIELIFSKLPTVLKAGASIIESFVNAIITNLPSLIPAGVQIIQQLTQTITENLPQFVDSAVQIILALADGLIDALPELIPAIVEIILAIVEKLTEPDTVVKLVEAAFKIMLAIGEGLIKAIPKVVEKVPVIIKNLINAVIESFPRFVSLGSELLSKFGEGIKKSLQGLLSIWKSLGESLNETVKEWAATAVEWGKGLVTKMADGIAEKIDSLRETASSIVQVIKDIASEIWDTITGVVQAAKDWGSDMLQNFMGGVADKGAALLEKVKGVAQSIRDLIGFSEPKKGPLSKFHTFAPDMMELFAKGIKDNERLVIGQIEKSFDFSGNVTGNAAPALTAGPTTTTNTWNITVNGIDELEEIVRWYQGRQVEERMK